MASIEQTKSKRSSAKRAQTPQVKPAKREEAAVLDTIPYPGLRYYRPDQADLFAGRAKEIDECGAMIFKSRVLLLHGPTGCGKSSFLRAGVKPRIAKLEHGAQVGGGDQHFEVIRSTGRPLFEFAKFLAKMVGTINASRESEAYGRLRETTDLKALRERFNSQERIDFMSRTPAEIYDAYRAVLGAFEVKPILVIDQGEEVFTLSDERNLQKEPGDKAARAAEMNAYFAFLRMVAEKGGGPLIISLRTEYKGQFDDHIAGRAGHPGVALKGFYLPTLEEGALVEAIRRPSLESDEWKALFKAEQVTQATPPKVGNLKLVFPKSEAEYIARELLKDDAVPPGGILPALQIACRRLYAQAQKAAGGATKTIIVKRSAIKSLGSIADQVAEYLSESIEAACNPEDDPDKIRYDKEKLTLGQLIDLVHRALASVLVHVEPDGRAVTFHYGGEEFRKLMGKALEGKLTTLDPVLQELVARGILRDKNTDESMDETESWSLGHDSVALALHKWRLKFTREDQAMMRMMMGSAHQPSSWKTEHLYPPGEAPRPVKLAVSRDFLWDRQLPMFASEKGFDKRLGFEIVADEDLDATKIGTGPATWFDLVKRLKEREDDEESEKRRETEGFMIAAEWGAFPLIIRDEARDAYDPKRNEKLVPRTYAWRWTDVATTNMNLGNGLIGPAHEKLTPISALERGRDMLTPDEIREGIKNILDFLVQERADIRAFDLRAKRLLWLAVDLVYTDAKQRKRIKEHFDRYASVALGGDYEARDPIVAHLMREQDNLAEAEASEAERLTNGDAAPRRGAQPKTTLHFAIAGAFPRAMAAQSGFEIYFGAKHLALLARHEMDLRKDNPLAKSAFAHIADLSAETQRITSHTLWQFSLKNAKWDFGTDRARVLRLAALAYYTTEYARTSMDELVMFLQQFTNKLLLQDAPGQDSLRGVRLSRAQVRKAVQDCYNFVRFEDYGNEVFDLDAPYAYWSDHSNFDTKSVAPAIYQELLALRQKTLDHFESSVGAISWLRYNDAYFPKDDAAVSAAFKFKELAWRHFKIFNFYDSERYMARADSLLAGRIDTVLTDGKLKAWREADDDIGKD